MFHTYRKDAVAHEDQTTASCNRCHGGNIFEDEESQSSNPRKFQLAMHREHGINLDTNRSCANCHSEAPGGTYAPIDD